MQCYFSSKVKILHLEVVINVSNTDAAYLLLLWRSLCGDSVLDISWEAPAPVSDDEEDNLTLGWSGIAGGGVGQLIVGDSFRPVKINCKMNIFWGD